MSSVAFSSGAEVSAPPRPFGEGKLALIGTLVFFAISACGGFPTLPAVGGDNDSLLRMVDVRDLLAGQSWFDLHQYRMGPDPAKR